MPAKALVAPVRERGLKLVQLGNKAIETSRSRKGAWIEIGLRTNVLMARFCRSRKGAWIEIEVLWQNLIQMLSRSRKGAWIEIRTVRPNGLQPERSLP